MDTPPPRTKEESTDLIARLDALTNSSDVSEFTNVQEYQTAHRAYMGRNYSRFMNQFEMFFSAMVDYSHNINYLDKNAWPANRGLQFIVATHALKQLYAGYDLLNNGDYEDALTVLRSTYESFLRIIFVSCHPKNPANMYSRQFNATNLVRDELKLDWTTYSTMSAFAHSNMLKVMEDAIAVGINKEPKLIALNYEVDDDMISLVTNLIHFLLTVFLDAFDQLFTVDISKHKAKDAIQPHIDKLHKYALIEHESLRGHDATPYWRQTTVDIEHIFELIKTLDSDSSLSWKVVWALIREA